MLDYWVGLGWVLLFSIIALYHHAGVFRFRCASCSVREEDCTIYKCVASCNGGDGGVVGWGRKGWNGGMGWGNRKGWNGRDRKVWGYIILYLYLYDMREREKSDLHLTVSK